ncbi:MAG: ribosome recycling factor [Chromatiales bacterium 21-64-14]|nr:MAG: ribosome recycling factor [Chromatiales bacterium 21-64-14]HQU15141.1 ribosome recycling factor [Gammaproteobacteria bacterium]
MVNDIKKGAAERMAKSVEALKQELSKLRTGRAHTSLLDHITVEYYGAQTPLSQVASVTAIDARTLAVSPWDKNMVSAVEKAIMTSDLGLTPATAGTTIRIPLPPLTEERRRDMTRLVRQEAEAARVAIRNIRRDANNEFKRLLKEKTISEDEARRAEEEIQKFTTHYIEVDVEGVLQAKEKELLEI